MLLFLPLALRSQTVYSPTNYTVTELECVSAFVDFNDVVRYFSGLVVKQGNRLYYLDSPYRLELLGNRIVFDDADSYTDRVAVDLGRTAYPDMDSFKIAAVACLGLGGGGDTTIVAGIDSIAYFGDSLYVYSGGQVFTTYIDSCPCEEPAPEPECVYVLGNPSTGEVVGNPSTGQVLFVSACPPGGGAYAPPSLFQKLKTGPPDPESMLAANCKDP